MKTGTYCDNLYTGICSSFTSSKNYAIFLPDSSSFEANAVIQQFQFFNHTKMYYPSINAARTNPSHRGCYFCSHSSLAIYLTLPVSKGYLQQITKLNTIYELRLYFLHIANDIVTTILQVHPSVSPVFRGLDTILWLLPTNYIIYIWIILCDTVTYLLFVHGYEYYRNRRNVLSLYTQ